MIPSSNQGTAVRVVTFVAVPQRDLILAVVEVLAGEPDYNMRLWSPEKASQWQVINVLHPPPDAEALFRPPRLSLALRRIQGEEELSDGMLLSQVTTPA